MKFKMNYTEAIQFCEEREMNLLDMRISASDAEQLFEYFLDFKGEYALVLLFSQKTFR